MSTIILHLSTTIRLIHFQRRRYQNDGTRSTLSFVCLGSTKSTETKHNVDTILVMHWFHLSSREKFTPSVKFLGLSQLLMLYYYIDGTLADSFVIMALKSNVYICVTPGTRRGTCSKDNSGWSYSNFSCDFCSVWTWFGCNLKGHKWQIFLLVVRILFRVSESVRVTATSHIQWGPNLKTDCSVMMLWNAMLTFHMLGPCIIFTQQSYAPKSFHNRVGNAQYPRLEFTTASS